tara:strand:+ start:12241 stop:13200 length:960 start_codon:yes stop_codon:yes gene_type:complete
VFNLKKLIFLNNNFDKMKIIVIGSAGQLGYQLCRRISSISQLYPFDKKSLDLCDHSLIRRTIRSIAPDLIINAGAYTSVDGAESNRMRAFQVNGDAPGILAEEAGLCGAGLIHFSTDYVFSGNISRPYLEDDPPNPVNVYGESKLMGERNIVATGCNYVVLRTAWVYSDSGNNFMGKILSAGTSQTGLLNVVDDQIGTPTGVGFLADKTLDIMLKVYSETSGFYMPKRVFHLTPTGFTSRYNFAVRIFQRAIEERIELKIALEDLQPSVTTVSPNLAIRPPYSVMNTDSVQKYLAQEFEDWHKEVDITVKQIARKFEPL